MAGLKTFVKEWNAHNAFVHPLKFDGLLRFYNELKFHILSRDGKMLPRAITWYRNLNFIKKWT